MKNETGEPKFLQQSEDVWEQSKQYMETLKNYIIYLYSYQKKPVEDFSCEKRQTHHLNIINASRATKTALAKQI